MKLNNNNKKGENVKTDLYAIVKEYWLWNDFKSDGFETAIETILKFNPKARKYKSDLRLELKRYAADFK